MKPSQFLSNSPGQSNKLASLISCYFPKTTMGMDSNIAKVAHSLQYIQCLRINNLLLGKHLGVFHR